MLHARTDGRIDRRADLLDEAARRFVQDGIRATTMESIARGVGAGKATLYRHFADKDAVVDALLERERVRLEGRVERDLQGMDEPIERIRAAVSIVLGFLVDHPLLAGRREGEARDLLDRVVAPGSPHIEGLLAMFSDLVEAGVDHGSLRRVDPDGASEAIIRLLLSYLAFPPMHLPVDEPHTREVVADAVTSSLARR